jgi:hypothetical protein
MTHSRPPLQPSTKQQRTILEHIFTYRFLTIKHLQAFLRHTRKHRIQVWLNDLIAKNYIYQIYDQKSLKATATPAVYYIAIEGVRYVRSLNRYSESELRKRYPDTARSVSYIDHCLLIASCCAALRTSSNETKMYRWTAPPDYDLMDASATRTDFLREQRPHLFFTKETGQETTSYIVEHFHDRLPNTQIRRRLRALITGELYQYAGDRPILLLICDSLASLIYVKRYARTLVRNDDSEHTVVRVTTAEQVRAQGVTSPIWEEVE